MTGSLRRRLTWILLALILFAWVTSAAVTFFNARGVMMQQLDRQLEQYVDLLTYVSRVFARQIDEGRLSESWVDPGYADSGQPMVVEGAQLADLSPAVNIWYRQKMIAVVGDSPRLPQPTAAGFELLAGGPGGNDWRILTRYEEDSQLWIRVGIELGAASRAMLGTLGSALLPLLIVLPLTVALLYFGVNRGLRPLRHLADQIYRRRPGVLDAVPTDNVPREVASVVDALNQLFERVAQAMEGEQRFTANAAHELMTPLAAIKTEVQLCQRQMREEPGAAMLARIGQRVDRASHTVEQLLTLARVDPDAALPMQQVALRALVTEVLAETGHLAAARGLQVDLAEGEECSVEASAEALAIALRNLLVNAFRYASDGSTVRVSIRADGRPGVEICNDCPPLSAEEFRHICDRFYRVPGSRGLGAGLGLSIVSRIAELHAAQFSAAPGTDGAGFCARLAFSSARL